MPQMQRNLRVLYVSSEVYPLVKTGGLADVSAALPTSLRKVGVDARLLLPAYPGIIDQIRGEAVTQPFAVFPGVSQARLFQGTLPDAETPVYALDCSSLFARDGGPYVDAYGHDWPDNALRFGMLSKVAAMFGSGCGLADWTTDIVHCNDWQAGLAPVYLAHDPSAWARSIMSIHNIAFQGNFPPELMATLQLPRSTFHAEGVEFHGHLSFLKAGLYYADHIVTVSPTYAEEIMTAEFGFGLQGLLKNRYGRLTGILNGIDTTQWDPATDSYLPAHYGANDLAGKSVNKRVLQNRLNLEPHPNVPMLGMVSRLTHQKGVDLLLGIAEELLEQPVQIAILGSGDKFYEASCRRLAENYPGRVGVTIGYDEGLAHVIEAGADCFLIPSRFEPCGLNQMYSMRYGTLPIIRLTGGLADSVVDARPSSLADGTATGFVFERANGCELMACLLRALLVYRDKQTWCSIQNSGMRRDFSWEASASRYQKLYKTLVPGVPGR